jgi:hypothetical protein
MIELKKISADAIPAALEKAKTYRLLNEPWLAESICRDVLAAQSKSKDAIVTLVLAITDQFDQHKGRSEHEATELLAGLEAEYDRVYYGGVIAERWAAALHDRHAPAHVVHDEYREAMSLYEKAATLAPTGNNDALLRWNTCARVLNANPQLAPEADADRRPEHDFGDSGV